MGVHLIGVHVMGMHLMGVYLMGVYLMDVYLSAEAGTALNPFRSLPYIGNVRQSV